MSITIDEVIGSVDMEAAAPPQQQSASGAPSTKEMIRDKLRNELMRLEQREMRLRAD